MRKGVPIQAILAVKLRFFATGYRHASLSYLFKFLKQIVSRKVDEVCIITIEEVYEEIKFRGIYIGINQYTSVCNNVL